MVRKRKVTVESVHGMEEAKKKINIGATVDEHLWRRLRAVAIRHGRLSGDLLDEAIRDYLEKNENVISKTSI